MSDSGSHRGRSDRDRRSGDPVPANGWMEIDDGDYFYEGSELCVYAELTDVDEVTIVVGRATNDDDVHDLTIHMTRVAAIALAGQLAATATMAPTVLPPGHVEDFG